MLRRGLLFLLAGGVLAGSLALSQQAPKRELDVWWEPSSDEVVTAMLKMAKVTKNDIVYDLGCGDGRIVIAAAKEFGARGVGVDLDPKRIQESNENAKKAGVTDRVKFIEGDLYEADIRQATVVTLFLWPSINLKLRPRLLKELKPGTRVVSHSHHMGDWVPEKEIEVGGDKVYFWIIPERKP